MTDDHQRGVGRCERTTAQLDMSLGWMTEDVMERKARELWADLDRARHDFATVLPWWPNNAYHLSHFYEQLSRWYEMRRRHECMVRTRYERVAAMGVAS